MGDEENIDLTITGTINVDESVLVTRVREALARGTNKVDIINGYNVETDSNVDILTEPIVCQKAMDFQSSEHHLH